jgi:outer membrane protein TolC
MQSQRLVTVFVCLLAGTPLMAQERTQERAQERAQERTQEPMQAGTQGHLTLADATARALQKNHAIKIEREGVAAAEARAMSALGDYDPQLRLEVSGGHRRMPTTSLFSGAPGDDLAPSQHGFESTFSISQLFKTGAVASFSSSVGRQDTNSAFTVFDPAYTTSLGVDLRQPLLRNRVIDPTRAALRVTALDRERSGAALARQVLQTVSEVETAYWDLVAARRDLDVRRGSLALAEQQRADTQVRIDARTVPPSDLAQPTAEVERRRGDLLSAQEAVVRAERALKQLMLDDAGDPFWAMSVMPSDAPDVSGVIGMTGATGATGAANVTGPGAMAVSVDIERALAEAQQLRPELAEINARIAKHGVDVTLARDAVKPRLDLVAGYTMRGLSGDLNDRAIGFGGIPAAIPSALDGGPHNAWSTLAQQKFPDAKVGISLEVPLGNRAARGQLGAAEAARRQSATALSQTQQRIAIEVKNAATALETAAGRIQAARAGLTAAETQLRAEQDRFGAGLSTNFFVLTRQNDLALAQLAEIAALTDYRQALTELGRATGTLLRDRGIEVR